MNLKKLRHVFRTLDSHFNDEEFNSNRKFPLVSIMYNLRDYSDLKNKIEMQGLQEELNNPTSEKFDHRQT